jgi:hypothetical protein
MICLSAQAQTIQWQDHPEKTFVFEINNKEAEKLVQSNSRDSLLLKMLHRPMDSFTGEWKNQPKQGHFIFADIKQNRVNYSYVPVMPFQVFLFKEYGVLTLQVIDAEGKIRKDAKVKIKGRWRLWDTKIDFDKESQTYTIKDESENRERILTVELDKFRAVFDLEKHIVNPWYGGSEYHGSHPNFYSYMITDKNKYKPGETVRFKSYALSENKKPLKKELEVWMRTSDDYYNYKKITTLEPYHPGGFAGEIQLHDSLKLKLDKFYSIQLRDNRGRVVSNANFKYEDYELYDNTLEVKLKDRIQYRPDTNSVQIKVVDANGLILPDMKADLLIKRRSVTTAYTDLLILPDTLLYQQIDLDNVEPTKMDIPSSLFGEADCTYEIQIVALTPDNQRMTYNDVVTFYRSHFSLTDYTRNDTIGFEFRELGKEKKVAATLSYNDSKEVKFIDLPYEEPFNQALRSYTIHIPEQDYAQRIYTRNVNSELGLTGGIQTDSFNIKLVNPLQLEVSWYIYQGNILLQKGSGKEFDFAYPNTNLEVAHYVELFYFMGDEEEVYRRVFVPKTEYLSIDVNLPERIYPGQQIDAVIQVKDHLGNPVKNADISAFAVNSLLDYQVPDLPYYGRPPQTREQRSNYEIDKKDDFFASYPLDFKYWNQCAGLEEMTYYQFTYPWYWMFTHTVNTPDSTTQFAPYVMKDGNAVDIYVIECNGKPVYFSWAEQPQAYSFLVPDAKKQKITLRLHDRAIVLDSMTFEPGKKTILSLDMDHLPLTAKAIKISNKDSYNRYVFTDKEINTYKQYLSRMPVPGYRDFVYLNQENKTFTAFHSCLMPRKNDVLIGPLPQGKMKYMDGIEYKHEGGFSYQFEDNVVYKYPTQTHPSYLQFSSGNPVERLNQFYISPKVFNQLLEDCKKEKPNWFPQNIYIAQSQMSLNFRLPVEKDSTGVSNLLFKSHETDKILFPDKLERGTRMYSEIPEGMYDVILLYNNGKYLNYENVPLTQYAYTEVNMTKLPIHEADSISLKWLALRTHSSEIGTNPPAYTTYNNSGRTTFYTTSSGKKRAANLVKGYVFDKGDKEPLIGVSIMVKGTDKGTVTDLEGHFEIDINTASATLVFSYIGYIAQKVEVTPGSNLSVVMEADYQALDEVVVVGYGVRAARSLTGSVSSVSASYVDSQAPPEELEDDDIEDDNTTSEDAEDILYSELMQLNGLRTNFADVGFWKPDLYTDRKGKAQFQVTFPDNITRWDAVIYAMNRKLKTGTFRRSIQSYKPLMAELKTPQFLVAGDSSCFSGTIRNYTKDKEIAGNILFAVEQDTLMNENIAFAALHQNRLPVTTQETDSLSATYFFTRNDGYSDGEKRTIPIVPQGTEIAERTLDFLRNGDKISVSADNGETVHIGITGKQLDVYMDATYYLTGYAYACNEQLASKLIGLLNYKIYNQYIGEAFEHDKNVNEIIERLLKNQNDNKLWSWWGRSSETSFWMSAHILRALRMAQESGYTVELNIKNIEQDYMDLQSYRYSSLADIEILHALSEWGTNQNYAAAIHRFEKEIAEREHREDSIAVENKTTRWNSYLKEKLLLWEIRQKQGLEYSPDSISKYLKKKDVFGAIYCDDGLHHYWYSDNLATTLIAYRIIKNDSTLSPLKEAMQMYILGTKRTGWNTYQAASAISTVFPDLLSESSFSKENQATVTISGKENRQLTEFPFETQLAPGEQLNIEKKSGMPLIYTAYSMKRIKEGQSGDAFEISSEISSGDTLTAGIPVNLLVTVKVKQENAEHVMIEIPIPAGCSYVDKLQHYYYNREVYREYFKEKTVIFCEKLPVGTYTFNIRLLPRYTGSYILNPAKVELMYFPVIHANNDLRKVNIYQ